jgi:hypothetical protein
MSSFLFSLKNFRWVALVALLGCGLLGEASKAAVVNIDLTGFTGDNAGAAVDNFTVVHTFSDFTMLFAYNRLFTGGDTLTGLDVSSYLEDAGIAYTGASTTGEPVKFGAAATIDASSNFGNGLLAVFFKNSARTVGDFDSDSFLGFKTSSGQFGYIEVTWTASTNTFRLISAAYESTPGVAIQTPGVQAPVPEPASAMIASLFLGGAALKRWRNKRA